MLHSYACRITHGLEVVKHIVAVWSSECKRIVAFQHTDTEKIHCHLLIIGSRIEKKQLRNLSRNCGVDVKGNENMSFKLYDERKTYLVYMTKGQFSPFYLQDFTLEECEAAKKLWVPNAVRNPMKELYQKFDSLIDFSSQEFKEAIGLALELRQPIEHLRFELVRKKAHGVAFAFNDNFATGKFFQDYKTLCYTYCFRHAIMIPKEWKGNY